MTKALALAGFGFLIAACSSSSENVTAGTGGGGTGGGTGGAAGSSGSGGTSGDGGTSGGGTSGSGGTSGGGGSGGCASPKTECTKGTATVCTDTSSDDANCGTCNNVCPSGSACKSSNCACNDPTKTFCAQGSSGVCVDVKTDPKNCGQCGHECPNANCTNGECDKIVFVTKSGYGTNLGGVKGADGVCAAAATAAGLKGTFQAWISDGVVAPTNSFKKSKTPYVLSDGTTKVADSFAALATDPLKHAIDKAEDKTPVTGKVVMTNVKTDGTFSSVSMECASWSSTTGTDKFVSGSTDLTTAGWTDGPAKDCGATLQYHLFCFEQ